MHVHQIKCVIICLDFFFFFCNPSFYSSNLWKYLHIKLVLGTGTQLLIKLLWEMWYLLQKITFSCRTSHYNNTGDCRHPVQLIYFLSMKYWESRTAKNLRRQRKENMRDSCNIDLYNVSTLFKTFSLLDGKLLTLDCYGFIASPWPVIPFGSDQIQYGHNKSIHVCLAHNRSLVVSSSEYHSKSLSSMDGWQVLQLQPTQYRL